jgi:hypothetical protein
MPDEAELGIKALLSLTDRPDLHAELARMDKGATEILSRWGARPHDPDSDAGYALSIRSRILAIRHALQRGDAVMAAFEGILLGQKLRDWEFAVVYEETVVRGNKIYAPLARSRAAANRKRQVVSARKHERWRIEAAKIWAKNPKLSKHAVARLIKEKLNVRDAIDTISRQVKMFGPQLRSPD